MKIEEVQQTIAQALGIEIESSSREISEILLLVLNYPNLSTIEEGYLDES